MTFKFFVKDDLVCRKEGPNGYVFVLPEPLRERAMRLAHEGALQGHTGTSNTAAYLRERYWWNNLHKDVADFVKKCDICRRARTPQPRRHGLLQQPVRVGDLRLVGIDLFGPLPMGGRNRYLVVYYDPFSHYLLLDAIETKEDVSVLDSFVKTIVLRGFLPAAVTFDNGSEFKNKLFSTFLDQFGIRYSTKIPYQPQTHHTERVNRFIKTMLKSILTGTTITAWDRFAQYVAYVYNTKCKWPTLPSRPTNYDSDDPRADLRISVFRMMHRIRSRKVVVIGTRI